MLNTAQLDAFSTLLRASSEYNALLQIWMESSWDGRAAAMTQVQVVALINATDLVTQALLKLGPDLKGVQQQIGLNAVESHLMEVAIRDVFPEKDFVNNEESQKMIREESRALSDILAGYKACSATLLSWINATEPGCPRAITREQIDEILAVNERTMRAMVTLESGIKKI
ncbi:hypothetical protein [Pseudomonas fluorescens]|uniref:hypothetical protein n=1 Tax=Pseudomonas fluorescens TaxID=294 RepID=UPI001BE9C253|nr:hypothetical protein [Pseudomonas fluorescens]MBT2375758.1 hypothetical protein [Pseudomonas fluorescens]